LRKENLCWNIDELLLSPDRDDARSAFGESGK
jgi:hypothetical protein